MQIFFPTIHSINQFTSSLKGLTDQYACFHCSKHNQWVAHGYVYKQLSISDRQAVGKRILCANRYGKAGCGHTRQLYLQSIIPHRRYGVATLAMFIGLLLQGFGVTQAYRQATQKGDINRRQGRRWIQSLFYKLGYFRSLLLRQPSTVSPEVTPPSPTHCRRLQLLLPTLEALLPTPDSWLSFQCAQQSRLM
jgi:hypothetical protein